MKWTSLNDLREQFLSFFEGKGHLRMKSFPLVPQGDKSLLLINSGMAPLKKYFLGQETPPNVRVTTCQKCIRTPDIERVGKTARHGTYFEMLGNFSFGDYFKVEATAWAWEFITKVLEMPVDRLWISIYEDDDEAFDIWTQKVGIDPSRIVRLGKEDNFWEHGTGPCGPCSEIYFDRGEEYGCGSPDCKVGCDCDRFVEFWNLVFSQFDSDGNGHYERMAKPNIDTGMGLERLACIMQGVDNLFEVDTVANIMKHISSIAGVTYKTDDKADVSLRVITDHIRSTTFMVADGVMPSNEGRGYVLRRLLRRAARHGRLLGITRPFLYEVVDTVITENASAYPELVEKKEYIKKVIRVEEENFARTIDKGMELLQQAIDVMMTEDIKREDRILSGEQAFKLYDTFGFPLDLIKEIISERDIRVDEAQFNQLMEQQKQRARQARLDKEIVAWSDDALSFISSIETSFVGYTSFCCEAKVMALISGAEQVPSVAEGDEVTVVLDCTPFYAQSGGQVGDVGLIRSSDCVIEILDTLKSAGGQIIHRGIVARGQMETGDTVTAQVDETVRKATMRNHTTAHLLQAALRKVLGDHVHQAGQLVDGDRVRFDFSHFSALTPQEIEQVELLVNEAVLQNLPVTVSEMPIDKAREKGAMALFGEKYGDVVRVIEVPDVSMELCGGTHVSNTGEIGLVKIVSENSVAAGVRRIEAVTGMNVIRFMHARNAMIAKACEVLKVANPAELVDHCAQVLADVKAKERKIEQLESQLAEMNITSLVENAIHVKGVNILTAMFSGATPDTLRKMGDKVKEMAPNMVAVIAGTTEEKGSFLCACGKNAVSKGAHAGKIVKAVSELTGGKGGGRPDTAMAGIGDPFKIDEALAAVEGIVSGMIKDEA